ncbi:GTP-binding protein [Rudaea cellulosilytica]|jgi:signal recognition particle receptor subunit beta|uniref:GTP-binding protein n=1 Tax=Rudaea cellulosilytica TaxID=540746 RepID=UPI000373D3C9|nr:ATP/GTP-binding protein [Rudaea cellulosilytica]
MSPREYKLIFTGSMGAGKTTAIAAVSEIEPCSTDVANNDSGGHAKATTTAALDYGEITLTGGDKLRLYGTPGQSRFDFMWKILGQGSLGVIILIDNSRPDPLRDLRDYAQAFGDALAESRAVVGIGRWQTHPSPSIEEFHEAVRDLGYAAPVLSVDVRERRDVLMLLDVLFHQIEAAEQHAVPAIADMETP